MLTDKKIESSPAAAAIDYGPKAAKLRKWLLCLFVVVAIGFSVGPIRNALRGGSTKDYPLWYSTGSLVLSGQSPYYKDIHGEFPFMYPPGAASLLAIISPLGKLPMIAVLVTANSLAWFFCIVGPLYLLTGRIKGHHPILYWLPSFVCVEFVWATYLEGQVAMLLSACLIGMLICLRHRIAWGAGALLALAAGVKGFPIFAVAYLIYRKQWKATIYTFVFLIALLVVLPMAFRGPGGALADLKMWNRGMGSTYTPDTIGQRKVRSYTWQNGSIISVTNRLLRPVIADHDDNKPPLYVNAASLTFEEVNIVIVIAVLALCLFYVGVMPGNAERSAWTDALEGGMLLILIIMFAPLSFTYNNSWLMLPIVSVLYFILVLARTRAQRGVAIVWLAAVFVMFILGLPFPALRTIRASGNTFWADLLMFFELAWLLTCHKMADAYALKSATAPA